MTKLRFLFFLAFIEGASVMACELLGAKMIAPFFGSSLYVWAAVLGVTLFGLMTGYYSGGYLSEKYKRDDLVYWVLILAGLFLVIMPYSSVWIMSANIDMDIRWGATWSLLVFMFPPLVFMGMTSPIIINMINKDLDQTGKSAGSVYAISTLGGIMATFLVGFYLLPEYGMKWPCFIFGLLIAIFPVLALIKRSKLVLVLLIPFFFAFKSNLDKGVESFGDVKMISESEGIHGQVRVFDIPYYSDQKGWKHGRILSVNNTIQAQLERDDLEYNLWDPSVIFPTVASIYPKGSNLLLMGLGGGMLYHQFKRLGFRIDAVELDERIRDVAIQHFAIPKYANVIIDDARHFINLTDKSYDIVVLDLFFNETPPVQVPTLQSFRKLKSIIGKEGMVLMNFYGFISGENGLAARSVMRTFEEAGFYLSLFVTPGPEEGRNLILCATHSAPDWTPIKYSERGIKEISLESLSDFVVDKSSLDLKNAEILLDEKPVLEKMYANAATIWRRNQIEHWVKTLLDSKIRLQK